LGLGQKSELDLKAIPKIASGKKLEELDLSAEEGFLLSRVDGSATLEQVLQSSGLVADVAKEAFDKLYEKGIVSLDGDGTDRADQGQNQEQGPYGGMVFDPFELAEEVDLDEELKKKILYLHASLDNLTHYHLLQVAQRADASAIKKAYFIVSKEFHPDSYFRKNLGSYKAKIELIFKRISNAYEVLSNEQKRKSYDTTIPYEPTEEEIAEQARAEERKDRDARLKEERRQRLLRRTPVARQKAKARQHYKDAKKHEADGDIVGAANSIKLALTFDPNNEELKAFAERVEPKACEIRAAKEFKRGQGEESMGRQEEALNAYLRSIEANPGDARALHRAASLLLELKRDLRQAVTFCRLAKQLEPDNTKYLLTLGRVYMALGMNKNAIRELAKYVNENPLDDQAADMFKELKKKAR
jgi:curved DNA-binding protein CbpA